MPKQQQQQPVFCSPPRAPSSHTWPLPLRYTRYSIAARYVKVHDNFIAPSPSSSSSRARALLFCLCDSLWYAPGASARLHLFFSPTTLPLISLYCFISRAALSGSAPLMPNRSRRLQTILCDFGDSGQDIMCESNSVRLILCLQSLLFRSRFFRFAYFD